MGGGHSRPSYKCALQLPTVSYCLSIANMIMNSDIELERRLRVCAETRARLLEEELEVARHRQRRLSLLLSLERWGGALERARVWLPIDQPEL